MTSSKVEDTLKNVAVKIENEDYSRVFDDSNVNWERRPEWTLLFLKNSQNHMNDVLQSRGHVFLNDVYDRLGFDRTPAGQVIGWSTSDGNSYIDYGITPVPEIHPHAVHLSFNVDGVILDKI